MFVILMSLCMSDTECGLPHKFEVVGVHVHTYIPSTQKTGPGFPRVSGQRGLHNEFQVSLGYRGRARLKIKRGRGKGRKKGDGGNSFCF